MIKKIHYAIIVCILIPFYTFSQSSWELLNPKPSFQAGLDVHFSNEQNGYIITEDELLETTDAGQTWHKKQSIYSGNDIEFKDNVGFIVGATGYILRSIDSGNTWNTIVTANDTYFRSVSIVDANNIFISGSNEIIKSTDGGTTWVSLPVPDEIIKKIFFVTPLIGHAACNEGNIFKTIDGGETWYMTQMSENSPSVYTSIYFVNENLGFALGQYSTISKTSDGGETWTKNEFDSSMYSLHFVNQNIGYAIGEDGIVMKTTDGGNNWTESYSSPIVSYEMIDMYGIYFTSNNVGYITGLRGRIMKTTDGGVTWKGNSTTYEHIEPLQFPDNGGTGYMLTNNKFYKTINGGLDWQLIPKSGILTFDFLSNEIGYAIASNNLIKTTDGGINWVNYDLPATAGNIDFISEQIGYMTSNGIYKTIDGGNSWVKLTDLSLRYIHFFSENIGYAKDGQIIKKTIDGGITWTEAGPDATTESFNFVNESTGYALNSGGTVYKTIDGGENWTLSNLQGNGISFRTIKFANATTGYIVNEYGQMWKTTNGGTNWNTTLGVYGINNFVFANGYVYAIGEYGKLLRGETGILDNRDFTTENTDILIYPNPSEGYVTLTKINKIFKTVLITDITGRIIMDYTNTNDIDSYTIDLSGNSNGVYIINILLDNNSSITKKIILKN